MLCKLGFHLRLDKSAVINLLLGLLRGRVVLRLDLLLQAGDFRIRLGALNVVLRLRSGKLRLHLRLYERAVINHLLMNGRCRNLAGHFFNFGFELGDFGFRRNSVKLCLSLYLVALRFHFGARTGKLGVDLCLDDFRAFGVSLNGERVGRNLRFKTRDFCVRLSPVNLSLRA